MAEVALKAVGLLRLMALLVGISGLGPLLVGDISPAVGQMESEPTDAAPPTPEPTSTFTATPTITAIPTETPTITPSSTPSPTPTSTATSTPTLTPTPEKCVWVAAWNNWSGYWSSFGNYTSYNLTLLYSKKLFSYSKRAPVPSCFWQAWAGRCRSWGDDIYGDCDGGGLISANLAAWLGSPNYSFANSGTQAYYMDSNCRYVASPTGAALCGFAGVSLSPISLVIDDSTPIDSQMSVVQFSLDPHAPESYSLWKGSKSMPLLVYDPQKSRKVTSAMQLFGNWTFGGRNGKPGAELAALGAEMQTPWNNGFEPLALLDGDKNGRVDGRELDPIALWFDENRDAVVDTGEMHSLADAGVSALFYSDVVSRDGSKDLQVVRGFERTANGVTTMGKAVDWFGETFSSYQEAISALSVLVSHSDPALANAGRKPKEDSSTFVSEARAMTENPLEFNVQETRGVGASRDLTGFWIWTLNDTFGDKHPGYLALREDEHGRVRGYSVIETDLAPNDLGVRSSVRILPLKGAVISNRDHSRSLFFEVVDTQSGSIAHGEARVVAEGRSLQGKSIQVFTGPQGQQADVAYAWRASKVAQTAKSESK
jgi:hypothetical protein